MFGDLSPHYRPLIPQTVGDYVRSRSELNAIFQPADEIEAVEVGDGNLNLVFKVWAKADPEHPMANTKTAKRSFDMESPDISTHSNAD